MAEQFDQILDKCVSWIIFEGETVEGCVARYPEHAAELRRYLPVVVRAARAYNFVPSPAAKDRGRQKLQAELHALQRTEAQRKAQRDPWRSLVFGWQPRRALVLAALVLAVLISSASTAAASLSAIPGEPLYPVKLATEEVRMALQFSDIDKAQLHLAYAEQRANEMGTLLKKGNTTQLESSLRRLREHLTAASHIAIGIKDARAVTGLKSELEMTSSEALANLQVALQTAPQSSSQVATGIFQSSGEAYSGALEALAIRVAQSPAVAATGTLQFRAISSPLEGIAKVLVEVGQIEAYLAAGTESRWITITQQPQTFDLVRIAEVQKLLEERQVEVGIYTRVRFQLDSATVVTADGMEFQASVSSGSINLARPFRVEGGKTTVVFLYFDGARSLSTAGRGEYTLIPHVTTFVLEPGKKQGKVGKEDEVKRGKPEGLQREAVGRETVPVKLELEGTIEALSADSLTVKNKRIAINSGTTVEGVPELRKKVEVEAVVQPDGTFLGTRIKVQKPKQEPKPEDRKGEGEPPPTTRGGVTPKPTPTLKVTPKPVPTSTPAPALPPVRLEGVVEQIEGLQWRVAGRTIQIDAETKIEGAVVVGSSVRVEGRQKDGVIFATKISLAAPRNGTDKKPS